MNEQVSDRELLRELAAQPIGSRDLDQFKDANGYITVPEAVEAGKRAKKIWLPSGKRSAADANRAAAKRAREAQIDIEDAVEAAGGERGHAND